jgi:uncharacterized protein YegL
MPSPTGRVESRHPWHVAFVIDDSASMAGNDGAKSVNEAMDILIEEMRSLSQGMRPYFKISVVSFGSAAQNLEVVKTEMEIDKDRLTRFDASSGSTNAAAALDHVYNILTANPGAPTDFEPFVFFLSDGAPDNEAMALTAGQRIKDLSLASGRPRIVTIGFGDVNDAFMKQLASNPELYVRLPNAQAVTKVLPPIGTYKGSSGAEGVEAEIAKANQGVMQL